MRVLIFTALLAVALAVKKDGMFEVKSASFIGGPGFDSRMARQGWESDGKFVASGPSVWGADGKVMMASGRSSWDHGGAAHLHRDAQPAVEIVQQQFEMPAPGNYEYSYKTTNGIEAKEHAALKAEDSEAVEGEYSWVGPGGERFAVEYTADETGYHAKGAHIPEIPIAIARSLEWNAAHPDEDDHSWEAKDMKSWGADRKDWAGRFASARSAWDSKDEKYAWGADRKDWGADRKDWGADRKDWGADRKDWTASSRLYSGRSAWESAPKTGRPAWQSASSWESNDKVGVPSWESRSAVGSSWESASKLAQPTWDSRAAQGRSAWNADSNIGGGATVTKITKVSSVGSPAVLATGRSAWNADSNIGGGATVTKITKTSTIGQPGHLALHSDDRFSQWAAQAHPERLGYGRSVVTETKVVEHAAKPVFQF